jgi:hypothetical protein
VANRGKQFCQPDQIGAPIAAGFTITGFFEDRYAEIDRDPISRYIDTFIFTRAFKRS